MLRISISVATCALLILNTSNLNAQDEKKQAEEHTGKSLIEKSSYMLGYEYFMNFKAGEIEIDVEKFMNGMRDAAGGKELAFSKEEIIAIDEAFKKLMAEKQTEMLKKAADKNMREGDAFLKENALKEGVKEFESGLQVKVIKEGDGAVPKINDTVKVHYKGTFPDGTQFDGTGKEPAVFGVGGVIRGMGEALQKMKVGSKWQIVVPGSLGYGPRGYLQAGIGPNQTLVFEIELVDIVKSNR